ncbi:MAG TPA: YceI family protein [Gaiellaceae bacterium]|nr:YceI family protein [Gaiellaceae bacterium]
MPLRPGAHTFGPENATLTVRTKRTGAASKAGHDLVIEVTSWSATFDPDADPALTLTVDSGSLRVVEGTGGIQALDEDDKAGIAQTIDEEVLRGTPIEFRSGAVELDADGGPRTVTGELELAGRRRPISFELVAGDDGRLFGTAVVRQTDWGMKPYTALFGTLRVADEVEVAVETRPHGA